MQPYGVQSMLKEGHKHLSGLDEAVLKNIDACKQLSVITRTSLGPNGTFLCFFFIFIFFFIFQISRFSSRDPDFSSARFLQYSISFCTG